MQYFETSEHYKSSQNNIKTLEKLNSVPYYQVLYSFSQKMFKEKTS